MKNHIIHIHYYSFNKKNGAAASLIDLANCSSEFTQVVFFITNLNSIKEIIFNSRKDIKIIFISKIKFVQKLIFSFIKLQKSNILCVDAIGDYNSLKNLGYRNIVRYFASDLRTLKKVDNYSDLKIENLIKTLRKYDFCLVQSISTANNLKENKINSKVLFPTCDEEWFESIFNRVQNNFTKKINLSIVGSIQPRKNQLDAISLAYKLSRLTNLKIVLKVVGKSLDDNYLKQCKERVIDLRSNSFEVLFLGHLDDYRSVYQETDVIVQTSISEGFSRILREAMYVNIPICAYLLPSNIEHISHDRSINCENFDLQTLTDNLYNSIINNKLPLIADNAKGYYLDNLSKKIYKKSLYSNVINQA